MASPTYSDVPHWRTDAQRDDRQHSSYGASVFHPATGKTIYGGEQAARYPYGAASREMRDTPYAQRSPLDVPVGLPSASSSRHVQAGYESVQPPSADELEREWFAAHGQAPPARTVEHDGRPHEAYSSGQQPGHAGSRHGAYEQNGSAHHQADQYPSNRLAPISAPRLTSTSPVYPSARLGTQPASVTPPTAYADLQQRRASADEQMRGNGGARQGPSPTQPHAYPSNGTSKSQRHSHASAESAQAQQRRHEQTSYSSGNRHGQAASQPAQPAYSSSTNQPPSRSPVLPNLQIHPAQPQQMSGRQRGQPLRPSATAPARAQGPAVPPAQPMRSQVSGQGSLAPSSQQIRPPSTQRSPGQAMQSSQDGAEGQQGQRPMEPTASDSQRMVSNCASADGAPRPGPGQQQSADHSMRPSALSGLSARIIAAAMLSTGQAGSTVQRPWMTPSPAHAAGPAVLSAGSVSAASTSSRAPPSQTETAAQAVDDSVAGSANVPKKPRKPRKRPLGADGLPLPSAKRGRKPKPRNPDGSIITEPVPPKPAEISAADTPQSSVPVPNTPPAMPQNSMQIASLLQGQEVPADLFAKRRGRPPKALVALRQAALQASMSPAPINPSPAAPPASSSTAPMLRTDSIERQERADATAALIALSDSTAESAPVAFLADLIEASTSSAAAPATASAESSIRRQPPSAAPAIPIQAPARTPVEKAPPAPPAPPPPVIPKEYTADDHLSRMLKEWDEQNKAEEVAAQAEAAEEDDYETQRRKTIAENERLMKLLGLGSNDGLGVDEVSKTMGRRGRRPGTKNKVQGRPRGSGLSGDLDGESKTPGRPRKRLRMLYIDVPQRKSARWLQSFHFVPLPPVPANPKQAPIDVDAQDAETPVVIDGDDAEENVGSSCHQCRRKNELPKMRCRNKDPECESLYCSNCVRVRYNFTFDEEDRTFICPKCEGYCNCSACLKRNGMLCNIRDFSATVAKRDGPVQSWLEAMGARPVIPPERRIHRVRFVNKAEDVVSPALPPHVVEQLAKMTADGKRGWAKKRRAKRQTNGDGEVVKRPRKPKALVDPNAPIAPHTPGEEGAPSKRRRKTPKDKDYSALTGSVAPLDQVIFGADGLPIVQPPRTKRKYVRKAPRPSQTNPNADVYAALNMAPPPPPKNVDSDGDTIEGMDEADDGAGWRGYATNPVVDGFVLSFADRAQALVDGYNGEYLGTGPDPLAAQGMS